MEIDKVEQKTRSRGINWHMLLMILCCLIPIVVIVALRAAGVQNAALSTLAVLVCPLSMVIMMVFMMRKGRNHGDHIQ